MTVTSIVIGCFQIDRMIPISGKAELTSFNYLFWSKAKHNLADGHIWFSVFQRPARSHFTRVQRLTCCLSLLFCTMCASIAWYGADFGGAPQAYKLGPMTFTLTGLYVGLMSGLMAFPINLLLVCIYRYSRAPPPPKPKLGNRYMDTDDATLPGKDASDAPPMQREKSEAELDMVQLELEKELLHIDSLEKVESVPEEKRQFSRTAPPRTILKPVPRSKAKEKKKCRLPSWFVYVGHVLAFCSVAVAFWATVEFGGSFGKAKSEEWLLSFFVSFFESVFLSQPLKVNTPLCLAKLCHKPNILL